MLDHPAEGAAARGISGDEMLIRALPRQTESGAVPMIAIELALISGDATQIVGAATQISGEAALISGVSAQLSAQRCSLAGDAASGGSGCRLTTHA